MFKTALLPIVIRTRKRIFKYYTGFSFFIFIWISDLEKDRDRLLRHEKVHFWQQVELLFVFHWMLYGIFYLLSIMKGQRHYIAYRYNPFELEAYDNDTDNKYLKERRPFAWVKYVKAFFSVLNRDMSHKIPKSKEITWDDSGT